MVRVSDLLRRDPAASGDTSDGELASGKHWPTAEPVPRAPALLSGLVIELLAAPEAGAGLLCCTQRCSLKTNQVLGGPLRTLRGAVREKSLP